jgi:hypothetical protein
LYRWANFRFGSLFVINDLKNSSAHEIEGVGYCEPTYLSLNTRVSTTLRVGLDFLAGLYPETSWPSAINVQVTGIAIARKSLPHHSPCFFCPIIVDLLDMPSKYVYSRNKSRSDELEETM